MKRTAEDFRAKHDAATVIKRLERELGDAQAKLGMQSAVREVLGLHDLAGRDPAPAWTLAEQGPAESPGCPVLFLSDLHWGEVVDSEQVNGVNKYGLDISRKRLRYTVETAVRLCGILDPKMRFPGIVVPLGGDMVSGDIHEELQATNELPTIPTVLDLAGHLEGAIGLLAEKFGRVFLPCVSGNHGRNTRKTWAKDRNATSFDWLLYQILMKSFAGDKRVQFFVPAGSDALFRVYNNRYLLTHGDRLGSGGDGLIGFIGPVARGDHKRRTRQQQIDMPYDTMICGHWHQYLHTRRIIVNGSLKGYDEYASTEAFPFEPPQQALWIVNPRYGETYRMPVLCEAPVKGRKVEWVTVAA